VSTPASLSATTAESVRDSAQLAAGRLVTVQQDDGYYLYKFHPLTGIQALGPGNLVRQAGCAYAVARAADRTADVRVRTALAASASAAVDALLRRAVVDGENWLITEAAGGPVWGKLGTMALTLAAVQNASLASRFAACRLPLTKAILSWQRSDGSFRCRSNSGSAADDASGQDYFPGEALLALAVEVRRGSHRALRAMSAAFPWYRSRFRDRASAAFVPWQVQAWVLYAEWAMNSGVLSAPSVRECADFVFEMTDWMLRWQVGLPSGTTGGFAFSDRRPGCSSASYTEAVISAFSLAQQIGASGRAVRYRQSARLGLAFVRRLQFAPGDAALLADPGRAEGGTATSLSELTIRCDNDQHALTAYLAALQAQALLEA
jgi:hypothetical protein